MAGRGAWRRGKCPSHLTPAHGMQQLVALAMLLLLTCTLSAATGSRQAANGTASQRCPFRQAAACFHRKFQQHFLHYIPSRASLKWHNICIQREKTLILSSESCGEISSKLSPGTCSLDTNLSPLALWQLQCKPNQALASHWDLAFWNPILWGWEQCVVSPPSVHYWHISEVTQNGKHLGWEQPKAVLQHLLKKKIEVALKDLTTKPQCIQTTFWGMGAMVLLFFCAFSF